MKIKDKNAAIFFDPTRRRLFILLICVLVLGLIYAYLKIFYPGWLRATGYFIYPYRYKVVMVINRVFTVLITINFIKLFTWVFLSRRSNVAPTPYDKAFVTAVIPAYNEEKVIAATVRSVLASDYRNLEVIVVDDGSADNTAEVVSKTFASDPRVRLIQKENGGKSSALNEGIAKARGTILLLLDADTVIAKNAVSLLVPHFRNKRVAAVSGNTRVGNVKNNITRYQRIEYIRDFNIIKNGMSRLNCMAVVPGALGAWRKSAILEVGGFSRNTLGEDRDITMALLETGYKLEFEPAAFSYTEAPATLREFIRQRFRWTYSTLQCVSKYRRCFLNPKRPAFGFILMPDLIVSQIFIPTVTTITLVLNIFEFNGYEWKYLAIVYALTLLLDIILFFISVRITKEPCHVIADTVGVICQKVIYGFLCTYLLYKSLIRAFIGGKVGWNKLRRTGSVAALEVGRDDKQQ